jgi:hypothetical protein
MKKGYMKTVILFIFGLIFATITTFAGQKNAVIYLKNGDVLRGSIYNDVPNNYLQLEMKNGSILMIKYTDIEKKEIEIPNEVFSLWKYIHKGFDFNINIFNFDYKESLTYPLKSTENGLIKGADLSFYSSKDYPLWANLLIGYSWAKENYDGTTQEGKPLTAYTNSSFFRFKFIAGYSFINLNKTMKFAPYIGFDTRIWDREITGSGGIEEVYSWQNIITGAYLDFAVNDMVNFRVSAQLNNMYNGNINILFSNISNYYPNVVLTLGNVTAYEYSAVINFKVDKKLTFLINAYYEKYQFHKSNKYRDGYTEIYEPSSTTIIIGIRAGIALSF